MGCGCTKVTKSQRELIEDIKTERTKNDEEIKKIQAEIDKANTQVSNPTPAATVVPAGTTVPPEGTTPVPVENKANPATASPTSNLDDLKAQIGGRGKFAQGLNEVEEELKRNEYIELGTLNDLVTNYFNIQTAKAWGDIPKIIEEIKAFCIKNVKPKVVGKTQLELSNQVEASVIKVETEVKEKNLNVEDQANAWIKEFNQIMNTCREELKKGDYNNLQTLSDLIDGINKGYEGKNLEELKKHHESLKTFFKDNLKAK